MNRFILAALALFAGGALFGLDVQQDIVRKSQDYVGCQYRTGGTRPAEFDCSGFVGFIVRPYVPSLPRLSRDMADSGTRIAPEELQPGDLVFFATTAVPGAISHVALYIGNGNIIHAISDGPQRGVNVTPLDARYWKNHFQCAVRVLPAGSARQPGEGTATPQTAPQSPAQANTQTQAQPATTGSAPSVKTAAGGKTAAAVSGSAGGTASAGAKSGAAGAQRKPSPWDTWDGYVEGDYAQWKAEQDRKFEESKKAYNKNKEQSDFEAWKKTQGQ